MMSDTETFWLYMLLFCNALLLAASVLALTRFQNLIRSSLDFWRSPTGDAMRSGPGEMAIDQIMAERLLTLQRTVEGLEMGDHARPIAARGALPFEHAVRMAKHGATVDELAESCGLNRGEAELVMRLHASVGDASPEPQH